jgi:hypothetical protein
LEISFSIGASPLFGLLIGDPDDSKSGYDTLLVTMTRNGRDVKARLKAGLAKSGPISPWSGVIDLGGTEERGAGTYLRLFDLKPDGSDFLLYFTRPTRDMISPASRAGLRAAAIVFIGNGATTFKQGIRCNHSEGDGTRSSLSRNHFWSTSTHR